MRFPTRHAIEFLSTVLDLPQNGEPQDWDIQVADDARLEEFLRRYTDLAHDNDKAFAFLALIIACFDVRIAKRLDQAEFDLDTILYAANFEVTQFYTAEERRLWQQIETLLNSDLKLFDPLILYWSFEVDAESFFPCTLFFRRRFASAPLETPRAVDP
jgi:hypothetical protein